jgi:hypothetical protein
MRASNELAERVERLQVARRGTSVDPRTTLISLDQVLPSDAATSEVRASENVPFAVKPPASPPTRQASIFDVPHSERYKPLGSLSARRTQSTRGTAYSPQPAAYSPQPAAYSPQPTILSRSFPSTAGRNDERADQDGRTSPVGLPKADVMKQLQEVRESHGEVKLSGKPADPIQRRSPETAWRSSDSWKYESLATQVHKTSVPTAPSSISVTIKKTAAQERSETAVDPVRPVGGSIAAPMWHRSGDGVSRTNRASPTDKGHTSPQIEMRTQESFEQRVAAVFHREAANLHKEAPSPPHIYTPNIHQCTHTPRSFSCSPVCDYLG